MKRLFPHVFLLFLIGCKSGKVIVSDEKSAVQIAEIAFKDMMTNDDLELYKPFKARLIDTDRNMAEMAGRPPSVFIRKRDGKVLKITWGEGNVW